MSKRIARLEQAEALIYMGPSLPDGLLKNSAMYYAGVLPSYLQTLMDNDKDIKSFVVPVSKIAAIHNKLRDKTSIEYARFVRILETHKGAK